MLRFIYQLTRLGHSLGKAVTVEGVEHDGLLEASLILGADAVQGYVIARPMSAQQITEWFAQNERPNLPTPHCAYSTLGKLAQLLLWEEHLHLHLESIPELADFRHTETPGISSMAALDKLFAEIESVFPFAMRNPSMPRDLVSAAVHHGANSREYLLARGQLVDVLPVL